MWRRDKSIFRGKKQIVIPVKPAVWNPLASDGGEMRCNPREVALSSASRDNSTYKLQCTLFLKLGSHYCGEPPAPAGGGSTYAIFHSEIIKKWLNSNLTCGKVFSQVSDTSADVFKSKALAQSV